MTAASTGHEGEAIEADGPSAAPEPVIDPDDEGGDPPCWAGLIDDHRDRPGSG